MYPHLRSTIVSAFSLGLACGLSAQAIPEGPEPNDFTGTPTPFTCGAQGFGDVNPGGDLDYFAFTLSAAADLTIFTGPGAGSSIGDTRLDLKDAADVTLATNDDAPGGTRGFYSRLDVANLAAGNYFVVVRGFSSSTVGSYTVDLRCSPPAPPNCPSFTSVLEGPEPNDFAGTPTVAGDCSISDGDIQVAMDQDWYSLIATSPVLITGATSAGLTGSVLSDTTLRLHDSTGTELAFDDDGGPGLYSLINFTLAPGTYYFNVQAFGSGTGTYQLTISSMPAVTASTYTNNPGGCPGSSGSPPTLAARQYELPLLGTTFAVDIANTPANAGLFAILGHQNNMTLGGIPLPFDLGPLGAPGCQIETDTLFVELKVADGAGNYEWNIPIPNNPGLLGLPIFQQALVLDALANALGATTTNSGAGLVGDGL